MSTNTPTRTIIFDLDGTLIECGKYYIEANQRGAAYLAQVTGLPSAQCLKILSTIDLAACTLPNAFSADRYPKSFAAAAMAACHIAAASRPNVVPYSLHMSAMEQIGASVFDAPYDEFAGVKPLLEQLRSEGWQLVLYTKGDREVQSRKITMHRYPEYFDHLCITLEKSPTRLQELVQRLGFNVAESVYIGDSLKDDIVPAKTVGMKTVHVIQEPTWAYDTGEATADAVIGQVKDLPTVLATLWDVEALVS